MRRRWIGVAGVCVVIVAGTGYVLLPGGSYSCDEAVPEVDGAVIRADLPVFPQPADMLDGVVLDPGAPLARASLVVLDPPQWWVGPDADMYFAGGGFAGAPFTVTMHDGDDGQLRWARGQEGTTAGGGLADDDDFLLMQTDTDRPLSVVVLDPTSGEVRACTPVGTAEDGAAAGSQIPLSATIDDTVVLAQPGDDDRPSTLYLVDPYPPEGEEAGLVEWGRPVEADRIKALDGSEEAIAFGGVENDINERHRLVMQPYEGELAVAQETGGLAVHAVAPDDGEPLWSYPADADPEATDAEPVPHTLLGVIDGVVVVTADRHRAGGADGSEGDVMVTTLVGLAALTGEQLWSVELSQPGTRTFPDVQLFGDVVVGKDWRTDATGSGDLVALDAATGQARWRIPDRTTSLDRGTVVGDQLLLSGLSLQGLEVVDIDDGQARTVMDGLSVGQIKSTGGAIGLEVHIGDLQAVVRYELE